MSAFGRILSNALGQLVDTAIDYVLDHIEERLDARREPETDLEGDSNQNNDPTTPTPAAASPTTEATTTETIDTETAPAAPTATLVTQDLANAIELMSVIAIGVGGMVKIESVVEQNDSLSIISGSRCIARCVRLTTGQLGVYVPNGEEPATYTCLPSGGFDLIGAADQIMKDIRTVNERSTVEAA